MRLPAIYGAIAFYLDHQAVVRNYLEAREKAIEEASIPLAQANPGLSARLERARQNHEQARSVSIRFLADADLNQAIVIGTLRGRGRSISSRPRRPISKAEVILMCSNSQQLRAAFSCHNTSTIPVHSSDRLRSGRISPGVFLVRQRA